MKTIHSILEKIAKRLSGDDVERILTSPHKDYPEVSVHDTPCRGFLLSDGSWLDIGGQDHRFINGMVNFDKKTEDSFGHSASNKLYYIMKLAKLIRFLPESEVFHTLAKPTRDQIHEIMKYCEKNNQVEVEYGFKNPRKYSSDELDILQDDLNGYSGGY